MEPCRYKRVLVTGGAGFIGSSFVRYTLKKISCQQLVNLDSLEYSANLDNLKEIESDPRYVFVKGDICDEALVEQLCIDYAIEAIVHFAAQTHVDRSIATPKLFAQTNVMGTVSLLEVVRRHPHIHFHQISTDEVYGSIESGFFNEDSPYHPSSAYSASKAAADHFVQAYGLTYGISYTLSHCTNNYGPCQHREKLIPCWIGALMEKQALPVYGTGENIRDWLFVDDHSQALWTILEKGARGRVYDIGGGCQMRNVDIAHLLIDVFVSLFGESREELSRLITYVSDRPGHDFRYAIDFGRIHRELGWVPRHGIREGLEKTVLFYASHALSGERQ